MSKSKAKSTAFYTEPEVSKPTRKAEEGMKQQQQQQQQQEQQQQQQQPRLVAYKEAIDQTLCQFSRTQNSLAKLKLLCESYREELDRVEDLKLSCKASEQSNEQMRGEIERLNITVGVLKSHNISDEKKLAGERESMQMERKDFETEKIAHEQELRDLKTRYNQMFNEEKRKIDQEQSTLRKMLEREMREKVEANKKKHAQDLSLTQSKLESVSNELEEERQRRNDHGAEKARLEEELDTANRAKKSAMEDLRNAKRELKTFHSDFCATKCGIDTYKNKFSRLHRRIQNVPETYFKDLISRTAEFDSIHKNLRENDRAFEFVPISESDVSSKICSAHAQRVITSAILCYIWKKYSCDVTSTNSDLDSFLANLENIICSQARPGSRIAASWYTHTIQALQKMPCSMLGKSDDSKGHSNRIEKTVESISLALAPLISHTNKQTFVEAIYDLITDAADLWKSAQTDGMQIIVQGVLEHDDYQTCRSQEFDPPVERVDKGIQANDQRKEPILTLFPRIIARDIEYSDLKEPNVPGSFPGSHATCESVDIIIHSGCGLAKSAPLLLEGREEVRIYTERLNQLRQDLRRNTRAKSQSQGSA